MKTYALWENAPDLIPGEEIPQIHYYPAEKKMHPGCIVIYPGGGYTHRAKHEGEGYAVFLNTIGMDAFVVDYRVRPYAYPVPLLDARRAVRFVRAHAGEFGIDPHKIAVMGSSAGGNLAALLCTCEDSYPEEQTDAVDTFDCMPDAQIHIYSYISFTEPGIRLSSCEKVLFGEDAELPVRLTPETHVRERTPQAFFYHTGEDTVVSIRHCFLYASALREKNIPIEIHIFPEGDHGLGLGDHPQRGNRHAEQVKVLLENWLTHIGF